MTCGYFSVSAMRNCFSPLPATQSPSVLTMSSDGNIAGISAFEPLGVLDHAEQRRPLRPADHLEAVELRVDQRAEDLPGAVGAEVGEEQPVAVGGALVVADHRRRDELVGLAAGVGGLDRRGRGRGLLALAVQDRADRRRDPVPALVAVHGVEAPRDGGDAGALGQRRLELGDLAERALRRHVAAVEEGVDGDRHPLGGDRLRRRGDVALVRVHAAGRGEPGEVRGAACSPSAPR